MLDRHHVTVQCVTCDGRVGVRIPDAGDIPSYACPKCGTPVPDHFVALANVAGFRAELSQLATTIGETIAAALPDKADRRRVAEVAERVAHPNSSPAVDALVAALRRHAGAIN